MQRRLLRFASVAAPAAALVAAMTLPASASVSAAPATVDADAAADAVSEAAPGMFAALQRDLDLTAEQAKTRLAAEHRAATADKRLRKQLGSGFTGSWMNDAGTKLVVAITDPAEAAMVRAAGAEPAVVEHSGAELAAVQATLDANAAAAPDSLPSWYVDVTTNRVVVLAHEHAVGAAHAFVAASGADASAVRVEVTSEQPRPLYDVVGGDAYYTGSSRCSVGFSVEGGFVTAGHCGNRGTSTSGHNRVSQGSFQGSSFPGNDYAWVQVNSNWTPTPTVNGYSSGNDVVVKGSDEAPVNSSVCRSGSTTGWHCGRITARNASVSYPQGTVNGLIRTTVCAEPGDSGGSLVTADRNNAHAQGVTSGGSGNCSSGGTTYFQPVPEILSVYGLTLVTDDDGGPPDPPGDRCDDYESTYTGSLSSNGREYQPDGRWYYSNGSGTHEGCLDAPDGTDFDLYLQRWNGSSWSTVEESTSPGPDEQTSYNGSAGYYRYQVHAYSGSGSYTLGTNTP
ncbi:alpha-lytic protease prodomain-containing protein [Amycolatopsis cihanbeyliensis]|uniref:Streptogrisin C n=1 Tax=Amycolatopsis cihanbeyliensis TaxID=1128664 RepID=A0A542DFK7_AMYCI|nr:alpha-lytic protease prodomain-containing protein [Amycolatopsis cihanbeyliensis]TQJ01863.1 streptogrisin C [Amycolatopsis cihanbeyliensis]